MTLTIEDIKCPAGTSARPVFSPNPMDVRCRVRGNLRDAENSPCCADYWTCPIWQREKDRIDLHKRALVAPRNQRDDGTWVAA